uniref:Uncharacterized protein n=1 Tax=Anopheles maculatus TaxID=74869 RepID=A0A182SZ41_9DIPT
MPSSQGYSKVASEPPIEPVDGTVSMADGGNVGSGSATAMMPATGGIQSNPAGKIPATNSQQRLMPADSDSVTSSMDEGYGGTGTRNSPDTETVTTSIGANAWFTVIVLCFVNLINYMDRFTIAGKWQPTDRRFLHYRVSHVSFLFACTHTSLPVSYRILVPYHISVTHSNCG